VSVRKPTARHHQRLVLNVRRGHCGRLTLWLRQPRIGCWPSLIYLKDLTSAKTGTMGEGIEMEEGPRVPSEEDR
jgi:hypothetical protein